MNVGKIQRLSETHENLDTFLKICLLSGIELSVEGRGHEKGLDCSTSELLLPCLRKSVREQLTELEHKIEIEAEISK